MPEAPAKASRGGRSAAGYAALGVAFLACPCHLPLLAALLVGLGGGSGAVAAVTGSAGLLLGSTTLFVVALAAAFVLLRRRSTGRAVGAVGAVRENA